MTNVKISEALELLNEAAKEKREELKGLMKDKYTHIREAMAAGAGQAKDMAQDFLVEGQEKIKEAVSEADRRVRKDPWPYIAGAAAASLLLGYLMGSKRR